MALAGLFLIAFSTSGGSAATRAPGQPIAFTAMGAEGSVFIVNPDGSGLRRVVSNAAAPLWSPDRSRLLVARRVLVGENFRGDPIYRGDLYTVRPDTGSERLLAREATSPTWSPDGQSVAFVRGDFDLWTARVDGSGARRIVKKDVEDATWSPDGHWIAFTWYAKRFVEVWLVHPDGTGLRRLVKGKSVEADSPAWAPDGRRLSFMGGFGNDTLYVVSVERGLPRAITWANDTNEWSPKGGRIMFERGYLEREPNSLWVTRPDGQHQRRLALRTTDPDWSPNGQEIAFVRRKKIYVMKADGTGVRAVTADGPAAGGLDW
jgi:Tol biopolymer transport system component